MLSTDRSEDMALLGGANVRFGSRLCKNADIEVVGRDRSVLGPRSYARIASIKPPTPRMRITRFML